jgi:hypothetical protein
MNSRCYVKGPDYGKFRDLPSGRKIETLNWLGENGGLIIQEYSKGSAYQGWDYQETKNFLSKVREGGHCFGVQKRCEILVSLFGNFSPKQDLSYSDTERVFFEEYISACIKRGILLSEFDFINP